MDKNLFARWAELADLYNEGLTHFLIKTAIKESAISGRARISEESVKAGTLLAVIGGVIVDKPDDKIAMPIGLGLYLHQVSESHKGTVNHSCDPNCSIVGFNRLQARRDIANGDELTIDYGTVSIGKGSVIIQDCTCGADNCRHTIKSDDYKKFTQSELPIYGKHVLREVSQ